MKKTAIVVIIAIIVSIIVASLVRVRGRTSRLSTIFVTWPLMTTSPVKAHALMATPLDWST